MRKNEITALFLLNPELDFAGRDRGLPEARSGLDFQQVQPGHHALQRDSCRVAEAAGGPAELAARSLIRVGEQRAAIVGLHRRDDVDLVRDAILALSYTSASRASSSPTEKTRRVVGGPGSDRLISGSMLALGVSAARLDVSTSPLIEMCAAKKSGTSRS